MNSLNSLTIPIVVSLSDADPCAA
jgi:hypothetical protein